MHFITILSFVLIVPLFLKAADVLEPGQPAPDFELKDGEGKTHKLADYEGKIVALYFYPKDNTAGCTAQACNLRDNFYALKEAGVVILGVSFDGRSSHKAFSEKYNLPFPLLSDTTKAVSEAYRVSGGLTGLIGPKRITYLIDEEGKIIDVIRKVKTSNHSEQILAVLKEKKKI
jgi:peroxiredoxin Q/BCP